MYIFIAETIQACCKTLEINYNLQKVTFAMGECFAQAPFSTEKRKDPKTRKSKSPKSSAETPTKTVNKEAEFFDNLPSSESESDCSSSKSDD
jgi:hypothetical protein